MKIYSKFESKKASKLPKCVKCGNYVNNGLEYTKVYVPCRPSGLSIHCECLTDFNSHGAKLLVTMNKHKETKVNKHNVVVWASPLDKIYFETLGFNTMSKLKSVNKYVLSNCTNCYTSGHIVKQCVADGLKIYVNGTKIKCWEDFLKVVGRA